MKTAEIEFTPEIGSGPMAVASANPASIAGLADCIEDARLAALDNDPGPSEPSTYESLLTRLDAARCKLPTLYGEAMLTPFADALRQIGRDEFNHILRSDPQREGAAGLMMDIAQAILQEGEGFAAVPTGAFEEVVSDLYDGFLSAEDRQGVNPPDRGVIPPLAKWGNPAFGPYTWPVDATSAFGCKAAVVNLPPANARKGLVAWSALGHETAGHDILHADTGLAEELADTLQQSLRRLGHGLDAYWSARIDETASDVMGILNLGPAAAIGLIAYFRGLNAAFTGEAKLRSEGPAGDPHPADVLRGYVAAKTVALLKFTGRSVWSKIIAHTTDEDVGRIVLAGKPVPADIARQSAKIVAETLVGHRARALENHALGEIQNWRDEDETKVKLVRVALRDASEIPRSIPSPIYAAHVVAAAVTEGLANGSSIQVVFDRMLTLLKTMHQQDPSWHRLFMLQGKLVRGHVYRLIRRTAKRKSTPRSSCRARGASKSRRSPSQASRWEHLNF